jgi:uncharacterized coiled-coil protein SlyX
MPTTRSSTSRSTSYVDASTSFDILDDSSIASTSVDVSNLKTLTLSIQANQKTIEAINSRLTEQSISLESTSKAVTTLDQTIKDVCSTVDKLPSSFDIKLETVQQELRYNILTAVTSLGDKIYKDLSAHHIDTTECFKNYATSSAGLSSDVINLNKNATTLQDTTLSKLDI